ncbi:MAG: pyrophosphohydrolase, partial [Actinobacteria bacterium]
MQLREFQAVIGQTYLERDRERGVAVTIAWLAEEVGELARAVRKGTRAEQVLELGDVLAWVASLANQLDIDFDEAVGHFVNGCPKCA